VRGTFSSHVSTVLRGREGGLAVLARREYSRLLPLLYVTSRCTDLSSLLYPLVSPFRPFSPILLIVHRALSHSFPLARSLPLMNSIAINSIKTSVVLSGFHPTPARRTRGREKDRGQEVAENPVNSRHGSIDECSVLLKASRLNPSLIGIISQFKVGTEWGR